MRHSLTRSVALVAALVSAASVAADTAVTFSFQTHSGFVDGSAVQNAFGLNFGQMQKRAAQVVFSIVETTTLAVNCSTGPQREAVSEMSANVDFTTVPAKGSFDGFALDGLRDLLLSIPLPAEVICGGAGSYGGPLRAVRTLSASLGGQRAVILEER